MISQVTVTNKAKFDEYLEKTKAVAAKYGAKPVAMGAQPKMLNGETDGHHLVVVAQFESMEKLNAWHSSDDYRAIVALRDEGSDQRMVAYEAMPIPTP
jgi:uncharacterized protein (DUF1330 family)